MSSSHDDCIYWGLSPMECVNYHSRLLGYYARRTRWHADQAVRYAEHAERVARIELILVALAVIAAFISAVLR